MPDRRNPDHPSLHRRASWLVLVLALSGVGANPQARPAAQGPHRMEITLQRLEGGTWKMVDPGLIFARDDRVRFRYRTNFDGYLYVVNYSTSGKYEQLFPRDETGQDNRITAGTDYTVPTTKTAFRIGGPAGHEMIYWMVSPVQLITGGDPKGAMPAPPAPASPSGAPAEATVPPSTPHRPEDLIPRCDDEIFRARGECVDSSAGPQGISKDEQLPQNLAATGAATPRDLLIMRKQKTTVVSSPVPLTGPVLYEFRLAHK